MVPVAIAPGTDSILELPHYPAVSMIDFHPLPV
jgi:hypothetical protein